VLAELCSEPIPRTVDEKKLLLIRYDIAVWDVLSACEIIGSDDASIRNPIVNDINGLVSKCAIKKILLNGKKAYNLYIKYCSQDSEIPAIYLPSTSPANASWGMPQLLAAWGQEIFDC